MNDRGAVGGVGEDDVGVVDLPQHLLYLRLGSTRPAASTAANGVHCISRQSQSVIVFSFGIPSLSLLETLLPSVHSNAG